MRMADVQHPGRETPYFAATSDSLGERTQPPRVDFGDECQSAGEGELCEFVPLSLALLDGTRARLRRLHGEL